MTTDDPSSASHGTAHPERRRVAAHRHVAPRRGRIAAARVLAAAASLAGTVTLTMGLATPAAAEPLSQRSSGMAAEFPVGRCIDIASDDPVALATIIDDLSYAASVPCTDAGRNYRVIAQVAHVTLCGSATNRVFRTRDALILCVVRDSSST
jgi:hypothetical protein